jgi:magnesium-protoporphyrin IX monomethyl ester (oxidative) cyclase
MSYFKHVCLVEALQSANTPIPRFFSDSIGVCYIAGAIKHDVETLVMPENYFNDAVFESFRALLKRYPIDLVGISSMTGAFNNAMKLALIAKEHGVFVAIGWISSDSAS